MTSTTTFKATSIHFSTQAITRGERALRCSPFKIELFTTMINASVDLKNITLERGLKYNYTVKSVTEVAVENELIWLIRVGILRREVDGQGITDSFRLTPLGRMIISKYQQEYQQIPSASWKDYLFNTFSRWFSWQLG